MWRWNSSVLIAGVVAAGVLASQPASAQDGMSFGEDEVQSVSEVSPVAKFIEEGKALYTQEKYAEASLLYYKVLEEQDVTAEPYKGEAQYELGKTLLRMKLYQGALQYFGGIVEAGEDHPFFMATLRGLVMLTDVVPEDPFLMEKLSAYVSFFPKDVPEKYRDRFAYLVGRHFYSQMDIEQAQQILGNVTSRSPDYAKARYISGVAHVADYDAQPAVAAFKDVLRYLVAKQESSSLDEDEQNLLDLTNLAMARVFYSTGGYDKSLKYFGKISRQSRHWPTALFESSWAYFQLDLYNKALGNLLTIKAPFFDEAYFPEGTILTAVLFFYNCKYERVRYVLEEFADEYEPLKDQIDVVVAKNSEDPEAMYKWMTNQRENPDSYEIGRVVRSALNDQQIQRKIVLMDLISKEKTRLGEMSSSWKSSGLANHLSSELELAQSLP